MNPPQTQDVEQDCQNHHQEAEREQMVVVDERGPQPAGVTLSQRLLLQIPGETQPMSMNIDAAFSIQKWEIHKKKTAVRLF